MSDQKARLAFEILARENSRMLMVYLRSLVRDEAVIDDLFQESMIHSHLEQLQSDYDVELLEEPPNATGGNGLTQLRGVRKSNEIRGPREIILWFAPNDGTIHRMRLDGLPRARGGPAAVTLELQDQSQLPLDYFSHAAHHEPSKRIQYE